FLLMSLGAALVYLGGDWAMDFNPTATGAPAALVWALPVSGFVQGVFLANAGLMLLELTTRPPRKLAINVPFVAANFQTALCTGLVALGPALYFAPIVGAETAEIAALPVISLISFGMTLTFVVMTKLHWNFTENTGKELL
ncbi:MAG: hypothetical protein ACI9VR_004685, partial [Cognaticolwellia sp.]